MATLFPRFPSDHGLDSLFRLLDADVTPQRTSHSARSFSPKFDVKEDASSYELHGELPGIEQKHVDIEFVDNNTLVIKGRTEREYKSSNDENDKGGKAAHNPTVEDEEADEKPDTAVAKSGGAVEKHKEQPVHRYWVSERSVGEFQRTFNFPGKVDRDAVKASLKNGILTVVVPKLKKEVESRKIVIGS
ncbi:hypothetical protein MMC31_004404 [Peltigera leucophlebia]|nr:hypothetical protein [Peltigera leucophlebia]